MKRNDTSGVHLWLILMKAHKTLLDISMADISRSGLCFSEFEILEVLLNKGPLPVNAVGERAFLTSGSATAAVDRLERRGLVRRAADSNDRRTRVVHLTPKGRKLISAIFGEHGLGDLPRVGHAANATFDVEYVCHCYFLATAANCSLQPLIASDISAFSASSRTFFSIMDRSSPGFVVSTYL